MGNNKSTHVESFPAIPQREKGARALFGEIIYGSSSSLCTSFFPLFELRDFLVWNIFSVWKCGRKSQSRSSYHILLYSPV